MKRLLFILLLAIAILPASATHSWNRLVFSVQLDTTMIQDSLAVPSSANGVGGFTFYMDTLWFDVTANGLTGAITSAILHSDSTTVEYDLTEFIDRNKVVGYITDIVFSEGLLAGILEGHFHLTLHTADNPDGEIGGVLMLEADYNYSAVLDLEQAGNPDQPGSVPSGLASVNLSHDSTMLEINVLVSDLTSDITNAHLHYGAPGVPGPVIIPIMQFNEGNAFQGVYDLSELGDSTAMAFLDSLNMGFVYVNVHTTNFPAGEVRGQLLMHNPLSFDAWISPAQEVDTVDSETPENAIGLAHVSINSAADTMWVHALLDSLSGPITGAHFHMGDSTVSGPVVVSLTDSVHDNMVMAVFAIDSIEFMQDLDFNTFFTMALNHEIYINVHTELNPAGEARGQVSPVTRDGVIFSLCTDQETEDVEDAENAQGSGVVSMDRHRTNLHYGFAVANLSTPLTGAHFHGAPVGEAGGIIHPLPTDSIVVGYWNDTSFTEGVADSLLNGDVYANFHTETNPGGEVRGQVSLNDLCAVVTGISDIDLPGVYDVSLYPNPMQANATLRYSLSNSGNVAIKLYNVLGKEVMAFREAFKQAGTYTQAIDASMLSKGVYIYKLAINGNMLHSGKFVKNK